MLESIKKYWQTIKEYHEIRRKVRRLKFKLLCNKRIQPIEDYINRDTENKNKYQDLAPRDDLSNNNVYTEMLDWAIENDKVLNIALTGPYGSGKSSILKTYEKQRTYNHYLNISLALFCNDNMVKSSEESNIENTVEGGTQQEGKELDKSNSKNLEIEKSILQQLFYKVKPSRIPYTRFRKLKNTKLKNLFIGTTIFIFTVILAVLYLYPEIISIADTKLLELKSLTGTDTVIDLGAILLTVLVLFQLFWLVKYFRSRLKLSKVTLEKAEIEIDNQSNESIFNRYLDEILYFFEATKYNVVFIEDLDRFNDTSIFIKLRELNTLINSSEQIKRKVVFVYAIKDDMFKGKERTKFFDAIIPVIPVINATNSGDQLLKQIKGNNLWSEISEEFINEVSIYIDDMRILNNIYNEYILYKKVLTDVPLRAHQMLALIIYKNLYPTDFAELLFNKGIVYKAFENKAEFIKKETAKIKDERRALINKLDEAKNEMFNSITELKAAFLYNALGESKEITKITVSGRPYSINTIMGDSFDMNLLNGTLTIEYKENRYSSSEEISISDINERSANRNTYAQRIESIRLKAQDKQEELRNKVEALDNAEKELKTHKLKVLIEKYGVTSVFDTVMIKEKPIVFLLRNGYIDETYPNYLTYFYENRLLANDMNFILAVRNHEYLAFDYQLCKFENLIKKLSLHEFSQKEILNIGLLEYLLQKDNIYVEQLLNIIKQLSDEDYISFCFIEQFVEKTNNLSRFMKLLCHEWHGIWIYIQNSTQYTAAKKNEALVRILRYAESDDIKEINIGKNLGNYIRSCPEFLSMTSAIAKEKIKDIIHILDIHFINIDTRNVDEELLDYIFENKYYEINLEMITTIIRCKSTVDVELLNTQNYTTILNTGYTPLIDYIDEWFEEYMEYICLVLDGNIHEDVGVIVEILNRGELDEGLQEKLIQKEEFKLDDITRVPQVTWKYMINNLRMEYTWENVYEYFKEVGNLDNVLTSFLEAEEVYAILSESRFTPFNDEAEKEIWYKFARCLINSSMPLNIFERLSKAFPFTYNGYEIEDIVDEEKIDLLINNRIFNLTSDLYKDLKEKCPNRHIDLIKAHLGKYVELQDELPLDNEDIEQILNIGAFNEDVIKNIIDKVTVPEISYDLAKVLYTNIIYKMREFKVPDALFKKMWTLLEQEERIELLINQMHFIDKATIGECLKELGGEYEKATISLNKGKLPYSETNLRLAQKLKECDYISSYNDNKYIEEEKQQRRVIQINAKANVG